MANSIWNKFTDTFGLTVFHPQFIINRWKEDAIVQGLKYTRKRKAPKLIDIGCGRMQYRSRFEEAGAQYVGVDHPHISQKYRSDKSPDILEDVTQGLSVKSGQFDLALFLHSIEYMDFPDKALSEVSRVLKKKGVLILTSPFMYPVHDAPYDKNRFTDVRLESLLKNARFKIIKFMHQGTLFEMIILFILIASFKNAQSLLKNKKLSIKFLGGVFLGFSLLLTIPLNVFAYILQLFVINRSDFSVNFTVIAQKI